MLGNQIVHHGASIPGIFTPHPSSSLPVQESGKSCSQQSLSMGSSISVDDASMQSQTPVPVRDSTPDAMATIHAQDSMNECSEMGDLSVAQEMPVIQVDADSDACEAMQVQVQGDECCECGEQVLGEDGQAFISSNSAHCSANSNNNNNNGTVVSVAGGQQGPDELNSAEVVGEANIPSLCCCDPMEGGEPVEDSVLYDKRTGDIQANNNSNDNINNNNDTTTNNNTNNNNSPVVGSALSVSPDGSNRDGPAVTPAINPSSHTSAASSATTGTSSVGSAGAQLRREASIEGDEFLRAEEPASDESLSKPTTESVSTARKQQLHSHQQAQRQSTDMQSSDMEFEDVPEEGRFLLRGCVAPAPTPAPMIAPLAEIEQDPQDEDFGEREEEEDGDDDENQDLERVICDKLQQQVGQSARVPSTSAADPEHGGGGSGGLEKQPSNESEFSTKTPPPELMGTLTEANKRDMLEPIPVYACSSGEQQQQAPPTAGNLPLKKRRKKREGGGSGGEAKQKGDATGVEEDKAAEPAGEGEVEPTKGDPVCPWEDE